MKTKILLAFSTALYKSLKYLPHSTLCIIISNIYWKLL